MSRRRQHSTYWRSGHALGRVLPGYGERHVRTAWFGTGEARLRSLVSKDRSYKPMVKSSGAQRESDGVVVRARRRMFLAVKVQSTVLQAGSVAKGGGNSSSGVAGVGRDERRCDGG